MKDCVSLEVAKKLQKAGWKGETEYGYIRHHSEKKYRLVHLDLFGEIERERGMDRGWEEFGIIPAPTATQLAEELPDILILEDDYYLAIYPNDTHYKIIYQNGEGSWKKCVEAITLPDALGLMMVYLLENGLLPR